MKRNNLEVAINLLINLILALYLLTLINPGLKLYVLTYVKMARFELYRLTTAKWLLEAKQVRGEFTP